MNNERITRNMTEKKKRSVVIEWQKKIIKLQQASTQNSAGYILRSGKSR